ncbi:hypothetical protein KSS87_004053 [Heliosperma pusillum]|nr:hypothetical protein KSS87_004053 [Heliosperma pusillum]
MAKIIPSRVFEDYEPPSDLVTEEECDTLLISLPGFKKEELRVQLTTSGMLKISGERPLGDHKYRRFHKEFRLPSKCDSKKITAKFEGGILYIRQPKLITPATVPPLRPPQPQQEVPEKAKDEEEVMKRGKEEMGNEDEEKKEKCGGIEQQSKVMNCGLFRDLRKVMVLIIVFFISYIIKSFIGSKKGSLMVYDPEL